MYREQFHQLVEKFGVKKITEKLEPHMLNRRRKRIEEVLDRRLSSVEVAMESPADPYNALAVMRSSEAMGVTNVHLIDTKVRNKSRASMGTYRWIHAQRSASIEDFCAKCKKKVFAADLSGEVSPEEIPVDQPLILLFGNENRGLSSEALKCADATFKIPIYGMVESYNLSVAAAITLYEVTKNRRELLAAAGDLSDEKKALERAFGFFQTVGPEIAKKILCLI